MNLQYTFFFIVFRIFLLGIATSSLSAQNDTSKTPAPSIALETFRYYPGDIHCCFLYSFANSEEEYHQLQFVFVTDLLFRLDSTKDDCAYMKINGSMVRFTPTEVIDKNKGETKMHKCRYVYKYHSADYDLVLKINHFKTKKDDQCAKALLDLKGRNGSRLTKKLWGRIIVN